MSSNGNIFCVTEPWPMMWSFDVSIDLHLNKRLNKQSICRWFETSLRSLWCHCNVVHETMRHVHINTIVALIYYQQHWLIFGSWLFIKGNSLQVRVKNSIDIWNHWLAKFRDPDKSRSFTTTLVYFEFNEKYESWWNLQQQQKVGVMSFCILIDQQLTNSI